MSCSTNLAQIQQQISLYEQKYLRPPHSVTLLAASKKQPAEKIRAAYEAGQRCFGENYLQEALAKMTVLADLTIEWHFIGPVQSNKTKKIAEHFTWVQSVDSLHIAKRLSDQRPPHLPALNICLEVNLNNEDSKSGVAPDALLDLARACQDLPHLQLRGLMSIPAPADTFSVQRENFHRLQQLWQQCRELGFEFDTLSMGMSEDFEAAIAEGATLVRIGSAIFGARS